MQIPAVENTRRAFDLKTIKVEVAAEAAKQEPYAKDKALQEAPRPSRMEPRVGTVFNAKA
jgi:hypothetical protein